MPVTYSFAPHTHPLGGEGSDGRCADTPYGDPVRRPSGSILNGDAIANRAIYCNR
jgi:hypothetical protein